MTDFTWPPGLSPSAASCTWLDNTVVFQSPLSGTVRTLERPGGRWRLTLTFSRRDGLGALEAFVFRLNGAANRAVIPDFGYQRRGAGGGTPRVNGAGQAGLSLITSGWPANTVVLLAGDRIGVSGQMIPVAETAETNGSGNVTLTLAHPIRTAPADQALIEIDAPTARYILANQASFAADPGIFKATVLEFEEAIP